MGRKHTLKRLHLTPICIRAQPGSLPPAQLGQPRLCCVELRLTEQLRGRLARTVRVTASAASATAASATAASAAAAAAASASASASAAAASASPAAASASTAASAAKSSFQQGLSGRRPRRALVRRRRAIPMPVGARAVAGAIELRAVCLRYRLGRPPAFRNLSLSIPAGTSTATDGH
jgi:ABC-type multidrug transport system fused ATPase/permease subunit